MEAATLVLLYSLKHLLIIWPFLQTWSLEHPSIGSENTERWQNSLLQDLQGTIPTRLIILWLHIAITLSLCFLQSCCLVRLRQIPLFRLDSDSTENLSSLSQIFMNALSLPMKMVLASDFWNQIGLAHSKSLRYQYEFSLCYCSFPSDTFHHIRMPLIDLNQFIFSFRIFLVLRKTQHKFKILNYWKDNKNQNNILEVSAGYPVTTSPLPWGAILRKSPLHFSRFYKSQLHISQ